MTHIFHVLVEASLNPKNFSLLSNNLTDFSQTCVSSSPMYALPVILLSTLSKPLNVF